ncbi:hypothetical protein CERSUDRAFT_116302 [Gelatoporia subvermispora B]|uniref:Uncharacterized protein n=1 Tax=Ceriporiopsis subvermispora (strain B) TaxID=914234 RepID=M2PHM4_CERS8|nr:hypothetical protein CERSUDRAFT_116302 [Gelatoporia subvermispora B]
MRQRLCPCASHLPFRLLLPSKPCAFRSTCPASSHRCPVVLISRRRLRAARSPQPASRNRASAPRNLLGAVSTEACALVLFLAWAHDQGGSSARADQRCDVPASFVSSARARGSHLCLLIDVEAPRILNIEYPDDQILIIDTSHEIRTDD